MTRIPHFHSIAAFLVISAAFTAATAAGETQTFRFGVCLSTSGEFRDAGRKALAGITIRMDDFNSRSAETGIKLEMVLRDDKSDPEATAAIVEELAVKEKITAIIGPLSTTLMLKMREKAIPLEVVLISPSVTSPQIGKNGDWAFRVLFDDEFQGTALARHILHKLKIRRAGAVINDRFAYAASVFRAFEQTFTGEGGRIVAEEHYSWVADEDKMYDFAAVFKRLNTVRPDIILLPVHSTEVAAIIHESLLAGVRARFCGGDTWQHENVLVSSGNNVENAVFVSGINFDSGSPAMKRYLELFDQSHDPNAQPMSVLGYDALSLLIEAIKNGRDGKAIREGLYGIKDFELATGTITIDRERGSEKSAFIHRINRNGAEFKVEVVDEIKP